MGACGCAVTTLGLYYAPIFFKGNYAVAVLASMAYGATLAGFVPLSAIMASLAPESRGAAMSIMNLGSGLSIWLGPALVGLFLSTAGVSGLMWIFAGLYFVSAIVSLFLTVPAAPPLETSS